MSFSGNTEDVLKFIARTRTEIYTSKFTILHKSIAIYIFHTVDLPYQFFMHTIKHIKTGTP